MQKEFIGYLKDKKVEELVPQKSNQETWEFLFALGVILNDIQSLLLLATTFEETYKKPTGSATFHTGQYNGIKDYIFRHSAQVIYGLLELIEENKNFVNSYIFYSKIINKLDKNDLETWGNLKKAINKQKIKNSGTNNLFRTIEKIRSNSTAHYYQVGKNMVKSYKNRFLNKDKNQFNQKAYFSIGKNIEGTRMFFIDAAMQEYIYSETRKTDGAILSNDIDSKEFIEFDIELRELLFQISKLIKNILTKQLSLSN